MRFCKNCGMQLPDDILFCTRCGVAVDREPISRSVGAGQQPAAPQPPCPPPEFGQGFPPVPPPPFQPGQAPGYHGPQGQYQPGYYPPPPPRANGLSVTAKVFMIIGCIATPFYFLYMLINAGLTAPIALLAAPISLSWCLPMTLKYCKALKRGERLSVGFKVCTLIFVSNIAGILMLCDREH